MQTSLYRRISFAHGMTYHRGMMYPAGHVDDAEATRIHRGVRNDYTRGAFDMGRTLQRDWSSLPALYSSGYTQEQLRQYFECSMKAIRTQFRLLGLKARPRGGPWSDEHRAAHRAAIDSPEWREHNRQAFLRRLPSMRGPSANSPLERLLHAALRDAGVGFTTSYAFRVRSHKADVVDILINQAPVVIEADGALHKLPDHQADDAERDAALREIGYAVYRFTGREINADPCSCIAKVIAGSNLRPDTEPIYMVQNGMVGAANPHWSGGTEPWSCDACGKTVMKYRRYRAQFAKTFCDSKCYGRWLHEHPEQSPVRQRWARDTERRTVHRDLASGRLIPLTKAMT